MGFGTCSSGNGSASTMRADVGVKGLGKVVGKSLIQSRTCSFDVVCVNVCVVVSAKVVVSTTAVSSTVVEATVVGATVVPY